MLDVVNHVARLLDDVIHEFMTLQITGFHLLQLVFPVAGQLG